MRQPHPSDLSDAEFAGLVSHLPAPGLFGRPWKHPLREILDGTFYVIRTGCQWRCLPHEYPPWQTVYWWFARGRHDGTFERLNAALRERVRVAVGRNPQPSAGIIDSQSVKTSAVGVPLLLAGVRDQFSHVEHVRVDQGYTGSGKQWIEQQFGWSVEVVQHLSTRERGFRVYVDPDSPTGYRFELVNRRGRRGFRGVLPRRWAVERTFAWLLHSRRLRWDYERLPSTDEALIYAVLTRLMVRRLGRVHP